MMIISKEYFACKVLERLNGMSHYNKDIVKGAVDELKENYGYSVNGISDTELLEYVLDEVGRV